MDFFEVVRTRQSIRAFQDRPIDPAAIQQILDTINHAPSAGNLQGYEVYLVTNCAVMQSLARSTSGQDFITQAPLALVFCAHPARSAKKYGQRGATLYCVQDATIACAYAQLAITALGLASVWVGAFNEDAVRAAIGVGHDLRPVAFLPIGYAAETPEHRSRRALADLVQRITQHRREARVPAYFNINPRLWPLLRRFLYKASLAKAMVLKRLKDLWKRSNR